MHIAQQLVWRKKLEEGYHHENPNHTYFENKCGWTFPLDVYLFANDTMCM